MKNFIHWILFSNGFITPKCILVHSGFHQILSEFVHFYHDETNQPPSEHEPIATNSVDPLIFNETKLFSSKIQIYQAISFAS